MNKVILSGVLTNMEYSHSINDIIYEKAIIQVNKDVEIPIRYKKFTMPTYQDGDTISLTGNIRSYTYKVDNKNKVDIYVFTYFDIDKDSNLDNYIELDGRICKLNAIYRDSDGSCTRQFMLANNIYSGTTKLSSYVPCVCDSTLVDYIQELKVNDQVKITGTLNSRKYIKKINNEQEERVAYEVLVKSLQVN